MVLSLRKKALKKSLFVFHLSTGSCNNCDIEILDCLTPRFDIERFGITLAGSVKHADVLLVTGIGTLKNIERVKKLYQQMPKPGFVVAIGSCACTGGMFRDGYTMAGPLDKIIPVDVYIPGCPPKPEAMIAGIVKLLNSIK
ncbi:MAG TPA: NADH-quinone oxidoreductase subunit B family protein [Candidatus Ratteibacteria bacterium]|jgi:NADH-quinone oxidoreductase B subunit|uniref:Formate hydrogenlyase subunit 7 n=1 Tax=candidate division TA06 bacterium ADurb.Bin131 TaxID=1852827 RepID=A0A1V6C542_UNCT6|nr:MAG: Formate hydrogenlyase subunit 7 [candidate division TA06 bacterium ADurb.Bin131]HOC03448.1 NADH-quinone oxidoreductase subunit B family protein [bacterium]HRS05745.1 NADH-quinone oxidoreductase subunit B family protein [Candidatus Ratteibacteria bacterium]HON04815.1 NADH-quinone oxidoreductase subunit B family protein [bacterium]HPC29847.1 NADH-quinone oxidoreductase subunit B family protein [bacterium]